MARITASTGCLIELALSKPTPQKMADTRAHH
jgi:hypothetical protein